MRVNSVSFAQPTSASGSRPMVPLVWPILCPLQLREGAVIRECPVEVGKVFVGMQDLIAFIAKTVRMRIGRSESDTAFFTPHLPGTCHVGRLATAVGPTIHRIRSRPPVHPVPRRLLRTCRQAAGPATVPTQSQGSARTPRNLEHHGVAIEPHA